MRPLSPRRVLAVWEDGQRRSREERALVLLASALPEHAPAKLADLPVGRRDALLLRLREETLGATLAGRSRCPACSQYADFSLEVHDIEGWRQAATEPVPGDASAATGAEPSAPVDELETEGYRVRFRPPSAGDLAAAAETGELEAARRLLLERSVLAAERDGEPVGVLELPEVVVEAVAARMEASDPLSEIPLLLECDVCSHGWTPLLDPAEFLWTEVSTLAERLMMDVDALARAYGWSEPEILSLSSARRQYYLELGS